MFFGKEIQAINVKDKIIFSAIQEAVYQTQKLNERNRMKAGWMSRTGLL